MLLGFKWIVSNSSSSLELVYCASGNFSMRDSKGSNQSKLGQECFWCPVYKASQSIDAPNSSGVFYQVGQSNPRCRSKLLIEVSQCELWSLQLVAMNWKIRRAAVAANFNGFEMSLMTKPCMFFCIKGIVCGSSFRSGCQWQEGTGLTKHVRSLADGIYFETGVGQKSFWLLHNCSKDKITHWGVF